jgi:anti-sigma B factor antagonist
VPGQSGLQVQVLRSPLPSGTAVAWVRVAGELDIATADALLAIVTSLTDAPRIVLDLRRLTFMDVTSLRRLVAERERTVAQGRVLDVLVASRPVDRLLTLTGLRERLLGRPDAAQRREPAGAGISLT